MKIFDLSKMVKGWFIGDFEPSLNKTNAVEVAIKEYSAGDTEAKHYHKIATEYTVVVKGKIRMSDQIFDKGSIVVIEPNESTDFECLEDGTVTVVVKLPGATKDKYIDSQ